jgi:Txe/YoeB family toxin of Txe-Axe toxin-antitoxin module
MEVKPLRPDLVKYLKKRNLVKRFTKQVSLFSKNPSYPSLRTERLEPKHLKIYSFRVDRKYRAIFIIKNGQAEIVDINLHYN